MTQELLGRVHRELIDVLNSINQDKIHHDGDDFHELLNDVEKALAQPKEEKLHPVHIGVDVTREGTTVTAFYRKPDAVMEMFYSQFHPMAQPEQEPAMWLLTDKNINSIQVDSIQRLINRLKHAHHTDIRVRINGHDEWFEADWLKHLTRTTPPQPEQNPMSDEMLQAITDPENQPSQYGTVTLDYHFEKIKKWEDLFERMSNKVLQQPKQEPVACKHEWFRTGAMEPGQCRCIKCGAWNTALPQRTWVGLTDDEVNNFAAGCHLGKSVQGAIYEAEAKLKEKNQ